MKVFISYAREDQSFCVKLAHMLSSRNVSVWVDIDAIKAGVDWASDINEAIQNTDIVIAVHSAASLGRSYQAKGEWIHALDLHKFIVPIIVEGGIRLHATLAHIQAIDFSGPGTFEEHFDKMWQAISDLGTVQHPHSQSAFTFDYSERLSVYPVISDGLAKNYSEIINHSSQIDCLAGIGHRFIVQHDSALMRRLIAGARLRLLIAKPNLQNLRIVASWTSASDVDLDYLTRRLRNRAIEVIEAVERMSKFVPSSKIEFRIMECAASFTTFQFDPESAEGTIIVTLYPLGPSVHPFLRPSIILKRSIFPDFYDHFHLAFEYAWEYGETISLRECSEIAANAL